MVANLTSATYAAAYVPPIRLTREVRGFVTDCVQDGCNAYLHVRDSRDRDIKVRVRDAVLARDISPYVSDVMVSMEVEGYWKRTGEGWLPQYGECDVLSFTPLDMSSSIADALNLLTSVAADGWNELDDPIAAWKEIRGCE